MRMSLLASYIWCDMVRWKEQIRSLGLRYSALLASQPQMSVSSRLLVLEQCAARTIHYMHWPVHSDRPLCNSARLPVTKQKPITNCMNYAFAIYRNKKHSNAMVVKLDYHGHETPLYKIIKYKTCKNL